MNPTALSRRRCIGAIVLAAIMVALAGARAAVRHFGAPAVDTIDTAVPYNATVADTVENAAPDAPDAPAVPAAPATSSARASRSPLDEIVTPH